MERENVEQASECGEAANFTQQISARRTRQKKINRKRAKKKMNLLKNRLLSSSQKAASGGAQVTSELAQGIAWLKLADRRDARKTFAVPTVFRSNAIRSAIF